MKAKQREELIETLRARFDQNMHRHERLAWSAIVEPLEADPGKLESLLHYECAVLRSR